MFCFILHVGLTYDHPPTTIHTMASSSTSGLLPRKRRHVGDESGNGADDDARSLALSFAAPISDANGGTLPPISDVVRTPRVHNDATVVHARTYDCVYARM